MPSIEISQLMLIKLYEVVIVVPIYQGGGWGSSRLSDLTKDSVANEGPKSGLESHASASKARLLTAAPSRPPRSVELLVVSSSQNPFPRQKTNIQFPLENFQEVTKTQPHHNLLLYVVQNFYWKINISKPLKWIFPGVPGRLGQWRVWLLTLGWWARGPCWV